MIKYCFSVSATQGEFGCFFNVRKGSLGIFGGVCCSQVYLNYIRVGT